MVQIEHGVEIPNAGRPKEMGEKWKLHEMGVGDSILIGTAAEARRVLAAIRNRRASHPTEQFTSRAVQPEGRRFWRTA